MNRIFAFIALFVLGTTLCSASVPKTITVPISTPILFNLNDSISSSNTQDNQTFPFTVSANVVVNGMIVVKKGALGEGHIVETHRAKMFGSPGTLVLAYDWVADVDGKKLHVASVISKVGEDNTGNVVAASVAGDVAMSVIPYGGFLTFAVKGRNVSIDKSKVLTAYISATAHVRATEKATNADAETQYDH